MASTAMDLPPGVESDLKKAVDAAGYDDDAGAPAGTEPEMAKAANDTGSPPDLVIPDALLRRAVMRLEAQGLSENGVIALIRGTAEQEVRRAHRIGHREGFYRALRRAVSPGMRHEHDLLPVVPWRRSPQMTRQRWDIIERYKRIHGGHVDAGIGFYYGTLQVPMLVETGTGGSSSNMFVLNVPPPSGSNANPVIDSCFDLAIGDTEEEWFGGPHILDLSDTNLQNPGAFLYPDQLMMIEAVSARLKAIRIQYYEPGSAPGNFDFSPSASPVTAGTLSGTNPVWDRGSLVLPGEFFNQLTDVSELAQAIAMVTTICFAWADRGTGGAQNLAVKPIERMCAVPGAARQGVQETSGAGIHLDLPNAYIWCLDKQFQATTDEGGNGLFSAQLQQAASFAFPFTPVAALFGVGTPIPLGCALEWQLTLWGTSLQPSVRDPAVRPINRRL